jgi:branched-chain amino acid transport system permease protein
MNFTEARRAGYIAPLVVLAFLIVLPSFGSQFFVEFVVTRALILGLVASTIVFLSAYGGMVSLAQLLAYGVAGFVIGNCVPAASNKGLKLGLNPWVAVVAALVITTFVALILGALSSRTFGIYFLMITLTYAVIGYYVFGQVATISGFGGITGLDAPSVFHGPARLYYLALGFSVLAYIGFRAIRRTPFGVTLEGIRDDPIRMASLGFHVPLHRALAFTLAGFVAAIAGVLNVWWNGQIDPNTVSIGETIHLLIIAVIGGIGRLEGAWLGALVYVAANNYLRDLPFAASIGLTEARFNSVVGLLVLAIVVLSPDGLVGLVDRLRNLTRKRPAPLPNTS